MPVDLKTLEAHSYKYDHMVPPTEEQQDFKHSRLEIIKTGSINDLARGLRHRHTIADSIRIQSVGATIETRTYSDENNQRTTFRVVVCSNKKKC